MKKKILIIEDELLILKTLTRLIRSAGIDVAGTASGHEGLRLIQEIVPDRIICDLMLNDLNGMDLIDSCKSFMSEEEIRDRFVIITAFTSEKLLSRARKFGCPILNKPFEDIHLAIKTFIGETHEPAERPF